MGLIKTRIEIDQDALTMAAEVLGTKTKKDTVKLALREVGERLVRLRALARLREMADRGDFDEFVANKAAYRTVRRRRWPVGGAASGVAAPAR